MSRRSGSDTRPSNLSVQFASPEPEFSRVAAAVLLRILKQHAERAGALTSIELSVDDPTDHQQKERTRERN